MDEKMGAIIKIDRRVEQTICQMCDWIEKELKNTSSGQTESILPEVIRALAELVRASLY